MILTALKALWAGIGIKDYVYGALIALVLGTGTTLWIKHDNAERAIGAAVVQKKDAALRAAATALNKASASLAEIKEIKIGVTYENIVQSPDVPDAGLVCHGPTVASIEPSGADGGSEPDGPPTPRADDVFDPSGALLTDSRDADAQINGLIDTVLNLEAELQGKTK